MDFWEITNLVRCALCWQEGLPEHGWRQCRAKAGDTYNPHWYCPEHAAMIDQFSVHETGLRDGAGI